MENMIVAGPCLINDDPWEIENAYQTAEELKKIDPEIMFRAKIWGGGLTPEIYFPGIEEKGIHILGSIKDHIGMSVGTEIQCESRLPKVAGLDFIWLPARAMQVYGFLQVVGQHAHFFKRVMVKRHYASTMDEAWGIHDICAQRHGFKPVLIERGVTTVDAHGWEKWIPDFRFMAATLRERQDIDLMFDPSHASGNAANIVPFVIAAAAIGVKHYMIEVYSDPKLTQSDQGQAIGIEEFKRLYDIIKGAKH